MAGDDRYETVAAVIRGRRMVRSFTDAPVGPSQLRDLLDLARRAPSAGNSRPWDLLVLEGTDAVRYWDVTLGDRRSGFRWQGLLAAPVLIVPYVRPTAYVERYAEDDKAATGLGVGADAWPVPYWWVDGGAVVENLLLAATAAGLGACFFGQFTHEARVRAEFGVPDDRRALGTVALGHPAPDEPGASAGRPRPTLEDIVHRGAW